MSHRPENLLLQAWRRCAEDTPLNDRDACFRSCGRFLIVLCSKSFGGAEVLWGHQTLVLLYTYCRKNLQSFAVFSSKPGERVETRSMARMRTSTGDYLLLWIRVEVSTTSCFSWYKLLLMQRLGACHVPQEPHNLHC